MLTITVHCNYLCYQCCRSLSSDVLLDILHEIYTRHDTLKQRFDTCGAGEGGMPTLQRHGTGNLFISRCKTRKKEVGRRPNVLWCAPFYLFRPTYNTETPLLEFFLEQIQELWYRNRRTMSLNIPGNTLFCASGIHRPRACILSRTMNIWMQLGFSCRDLVAILINNNEVKAERRSVVCSAYLSL